MIKLRDVICSQELKIFLKVCRPFHQTLIIALHKVHLNQTLNVFISYVIYKYT